MPVARRCPLAPLAAALLLALAAPRGAPAGTVTLKNGTVLRGTVDNDDTIVSIFDGLTRTLVRDTKVARISNEADPGYVVFNPQQPLQVHGGAMPAYAFNIRASGWDRLGQRRFEYVGPRSTKPVRMMQGINVLGPRVVQYRGIDGFWQGQVATSQVPKEVVLGLLKQANQKDEETRLQVSQFLIQAEWYAEAAENLAQLEKDFPETRPNVEAARRLVQDLQSRQELYEISTREGAGQPRAARARLAAFPNAGAAAPVVIEVRDRLRKLDAQAADDKALAESLQKAADALGDDARKAAKDRLIEVLAALTEAPDAVRGRLAPFRAADPDRPAEARFALALSGWVAGAEGAVEDPAAANALWAARDAVRTYLASSEETDRSAALSALGQIKLPGPMPGSEAGLDLATLTRIVRLMPPPLRDARWEQPGETRLLRVLDDPNPALPTEYAVRLPPEYHPLRSYPAVVALRGTPESAVAWFADEAARRGYIVLAPDYRTSKEAIDYHYSASEHAAVVLALRDALRRFAIDADRVFLGGQLVGAKMAWDFGLAHPDLFAGVSVISGLPQKYPWAYRDNAKLVPLYVALGDLAPGEQGAIFPLAKSLVGRNYDFTYVEYYRRGLEDLPEEAPKAFDWMGHRRRDPAPKDEVAFATARSSDARAFGVVVQEWSRGRSIEPAVADDLGKNIRPATVSLQPKGFGSLLLLKTDGVRRLDLWVSPQQVDLTKRLEVRVNGRTLFKNMPRVDLEAFLEDLRLRGDRQQLYAMKIPLNLTGR